MLLLAGLLLSCRPSSPPNGLAIGVSGMDGFGLSTLWIEMSGDTVIASEVFSGLRLLSPAGPQHIHEIAARAEQQCTVEWTEDCAIHLSAVVREPTGSTALRDALQALQVSADTQVGCTSGYTLERLRYATLDGYTTQILDGGSACGTPGPGYETLSYASHFWGAPPTLPPEAVDALRAELLVSYPHLDDAVQMAGATLVTERAAGVTRSRLAVIVEEGDAAAELSVLVSEETDPTPMTSVLQRWPLATDVMTAPSGTLAVVRLGSDHFAVVRREGGGVLWQQELPGRIVMTQWVTDVAAWRAALRAGPGS